MLQGLAGAVEIEGNGQIRVGGVELQADLVVDGGLAVGMVINSGSLGRWAPAPQLEVQKAWVEVQGPWLEAQVAGFQGWPSSQKGQ